MRNDHRYLRCCTTTAAMIAWFSFGSPVQAQAWEWTGGFADDRWGWCGQFDPNWSFSPGFPGVLIDCTGDGFPEDYRGVNVLIASGPEMVNTAGVGGGQNGEFRLGSLTVEGSSIGGQPRLSLTHLLILDGPGFLEDVTFGANFIANGNVSLQDGCRWINATTFSGNGAINVDGGVFAIGSQNTGRFLSGIELTNNAQVTHFNNLQLLNNAVIDNEGVWTLGNTIHNAGFNLAPGEYGLISNDGVITTNLGSQTATINAPLFSTGDINVNESTVSIGGGGVHSAGTYMIAEDAVLTFGAAVDETHISGDVAASGAGTLHITNDFVIDVLGSLTLNLPGSEFFNFTGGLLGASTSTARMTCDGPLINNNKLWWTAMTVDGTDGIVNEPSGELFMIKFGGQNLRVLETSLVNRGHVVQEDPLVLNGGIVSNGPLSGIWTIVSGNITGTGTFDNRWVVEKPQTALAGVGDSTITVPLNFGVTGVTGGAILRNASDNWIILTGGGSVTSGGRMHVVELSNRIQIKDCTYTVEGGDLEFVGAGYIEFDNAILSMPGGYAENIGPDIDMFGGLVAGSGSFRNVQGVVWLHGTTIGFPAGVTNSSSMNLDPVTVDGTLTNNSAGFITQFLGSTIGATGTIVNNGQYTILADLNIASGGSFMNNSLFKQPASETGEENTVTGLFSNIGVVRVDAGTLNITGPVAQLNGTTLTGGSWVVESGAQLNLGNCALINAIGNGAALQGDGAGFSNCVQIDTNGGSCTWTGDYSTLASCDNTGDWNVESGTVIINGDFNSGDIDGATTGVTGSGEMECTGDINNGTPDGGFLSHMDQYFVGGLASGPTGGFLCQNFNSYSVVLPGGQNEVGPFNLTGNFNQFDVGSLEIDLNGTTPISGHDQLIVTDGDVNLAGTLHLTVLPTFNPVGGEQFTIITVTNGEIMGEFDQTSGGGAWTIQYNPSSVVLTLDVAPCTADANADGVVNVSDLLKVLADWGSCPFGCDGDVNFDNLVNVSDLLLLLASWGQCD